MNNYLGTIIKTVRVNKGFTQKELAHDICTVRQLTRIEANKSSPSTFIFQKLSARLGDELLQYLPYSTELQGYTIKSFFDIAYRFYANFPNFTHSMPPDLLKIDGNGI